MTRPTAGRVRRSPGASRTARSSRWTAARWSASTGASTASRCSFPRASCPPRPERMASRTLTVGVVQQRCGERRDENLAAGVAGIREAARRGARLVLLPELHALRYFCQTEDPALFDLAEPVPGPTTEALAPPPAQPHLALLP